MLGVVSLQEADQRDRHIGGKKKIKLTLDVPTTRVRSTQKKGASKFKLIGYPEWWPDAKKKGRKITYGGMQKGEANLSTQEEDIDEVEAPKQGGAIITT